MIDKAVLADLRQRDYAQYLALWLVPLERRAFALALFNLEAELRAIPAKVTEPTLGLMRIVWWRDAVAGLAHGEIKAHPLLQALEPYMTAERGALVAEWVETFDLPFLPQDEENQRLLERQRLEISLLGQPAASFLAKAQGSNHIRLIIQALRLAIWSKA